MVPGVTAINFAFLMGKELKGFKGAIILTIAGILPSIVVITIIALYANLNPNNIYAQKFFEGAKISSTIIMSTIIFEFSKKMLKKSITKWTICLLTTYTLYKFHIDISYILLTFLPICFVTYKVKKNFLKKRYRFEFNKFIHYIFQNRNSKFRWRKRNYNDNQ
ncbi:Chromate transport protein [Borrelia coriaceae ATCC 43381]|uniref:Chromate transport protein n=1 Tax=Borrelia coriaceae ATCC 43381 TaxID=1408429 RepID=W5SVC4_9SPIR|nr:Chromate transport protein [Borrelia coriaceae ATCC 43381]